MIKFTINERVHYEGEDYIVDDIYQSFIKLLRLKAPPPGRPPIRVVYKDMYPLVARGAK